MDWDMFLILAIGFVFSGVIIGYPLGHLMAMRQARRRSAQLSRINIHRGSSRAATGSLVLAGRRDDILSAEILEVNHD